MMAPKFERVRMLDAAISVAPHHLEAPIDRIEVAGGKVLVWAGGRKVTLRYDYSDSFDSQGSVLLGGGHWSAQMMDEAAAPPRGFWKRLFGRG